MSKSKLLQLICNGVARFMVENPTMVAPVLNHTLSTIAEIMAARVAEEDRDAGERRSYLSSLDEIARRMDKLEKERRS